jgi:hypothetical protein
VIKNIAEEKYLDTEENYEFEGFGFEENDSDIDLASFEDLAEAASSAARALDIEAGKAEKAKEAEIAKADKAEEAEIAKAEKAKIEKAKAEAETKLREAAEKVKAKEAEIAKAEKAKIEKAKSEEAKAEAETKLREAAEKVKAKEAEKAKAEAETKLREAAEKVKEKLAKEGRLEAAERVDKEKLAAEDEQLEEKERFANETRLKDNEDLLEEIEEERLETISKAKDAKERKLAEAIAKGRIADDHDKIVTFGDDNTEDFGGHTGDDDESSNCDAKNQKEKIEFVLKRMKEISIGSTGITLIYSEDDGTKNDTGAIVKIDIDDVKGTSIIVDIADRGEESFDLTNDVIDFKFFTLQSQTKDDDYNPTGADAAGAPTDNDAAGAMKDKEIEHLRRQLKEEKEKNNGNPKMKKSSNVAKKKANRLIGDRPRTYKQQKDATTRRTSEQLMARYLELNFGSQLAAEQKGPGDPQLWHFYVCMDQLTRHFSSKTKNDAEDVGQWFRNRKCIILHDPSVDLKLLGELFKKAGEELTNGIYDFVKPTTEVEVAHEFIYSKKSDTAPSIKSKMNDSVLKTLAKEEEEEEEKKKKTASATGVGITLMAHV